MKTLLVLLLLPLIAACARPAPQPEPQVLQLKDALLTEDTLWQGRILIDGTVRVTKQATLTILPGTDIAFVHRDADQDGLGDGTLQIDGILHARGTPEGPIIFRSAAADPQPGDWLEIHVDFSPEIHLRYCEIRDSAYALHAHFTKGIVEDCTIRGNIDGCRLGRARFVWRNNLIEANIGKGINFRDSHIEVTRNILRRNGAGIFLFEKDQGSPIHHNNFHDNGNNFRLGDFYTGEVSLRANWWGDADPQAAAQTVYDSRVDPAIGTVHLDPAGGWISGTGPRALIDLREEWHFAAEGFIDAPVQVLDRNLAVVSWDGRIYLLDPEGHLLWSRDLGDIVDTRPARYGDLLFAHTWNREVVALDADNGRVRWRWSYPASPADDHRQGALVVAGGLLLVPAWNGTLYALDPARGEILWQHGGNLPLRAAPAVAGGRIYLPGGNGTLSALSLEGALLWERSCPGPLLSSPALVAGGPVVLGKDGTMVAFDPSGKERWRQSLDEPCFYGAPVAARGALFAATAGGSLWKIDGASGRTIWRQPLSGPSYATPLWHEGDVYIGDNAGTLQVFGADSGTLRGRWTAAAPIQAAPVFSAGRLLSTGRDGRLNALRVEKKAPSADGR